MVDISVRGNLMPPSPIRKLQPYANQAVAEGKHIYYLNIGQPDIETPVPMLKALENYDQVILPYGPSEGLKEYIDVLVKYYQKHQIELDPKNIIVTTGGSEAIMMGFTVCLDAGDEVLIPEPFYANYNGFAVACGIKIKPITTRLDDDWQLPTIEEIEKLIGPKTKGIMICNPNNPTGKVYGLPEMKKIAFLAKKHNLFLFGDEVYREFIFNKEEHVSLLDFDALHDNVVVMDSISKRFSSCGARIGAFISRNEEIMKAALAFAQARLCPPTLEQYLAIPSLELGDEYFDNIIAEYKSRRDTVISALSEMEGVRFKVPNGAFYITVELPVFNAQDFVIWLLTDFSIDNETLMMAPANGFYKTEGLGEKEVRIAFVLNAQKTKKAMRILKEGLATYLASH